MNTANRSATTIVLAIVAGLLLVALGVGAYFLFSQSGGSQLADPQLQEVTSSASVTTEPEEDKEADKKDKKRPEDPDLPSAAIPANDAARNGEPAGNFNNVYLSGPTSEEFALIVRDKFVDQYLDTKETSAVVEAHSPVTGQSYSMDCQDRGGYVHCTGGNDANVYIA